MACNRTDADNRLEEELGIERIFYLPGNFFDVVVIRAKRQLLDENDNRLAHAENEVLLPVREKVLHHLNGADLYLVLLADKKYRARRMNVDMQLLCANVEIRKQRIV